MDLNCFILSISQIRAIISAVRNILKKFLISLFIGHTCRYNSSKQLVNQAFKITPTPSEPETERKQNDVSFSCAILKFKPEHSDKRRKEYALCRQTPAERVRF